MTRDFRERGLIVNEDVADYDGTTAVVRTEHLSADEIEFMRWRAERWMKVRHMPAAFAHSPRFVLRHGLRDAGAHLHRHDACARCSASKSERAVFERYRNQRRRVRENLMPDPLLAKRIVVGIRPDDLPGGVARPRATAS